MGKIMKCLKLLKTLYDKRNPIAYAKKLGVTIGNDTKLVDNPNWGSEPYLITIGEDCLISGDVTFITHDGELQ